MTMRNDTITGIASLQQQQLCQGRDDKIVSSCPSELLVYPTQHNSSDDHPPDQYTGFLVSNCKNATSEWHHTNRLSDAADGCAFPKIFCVLCMHEVDHAYDMYRAPWVSRPQGTRLAESRAKIYYLGTKLRRQRHVGVAAEPPQVVTGAHELSRKL